MAKKKPTVFIETTVPSFYFETRRHSKQIIWRESTRRWWEQSRPQFHVVTSRAVIAEVDNTPEPKRSQMLALLEQIDVLAEPSGVRELAEYYISQHVMPAGALGDALHLAFASMHGADFLLTWNCKHLANARKFKHIQVINDRLGLTSPVICTPDILRAEDPS